MNTDPLRNGNDPLRKSGPKTEQDLFRALSDVCRDYPIDHVLGAAMNLVINATRQNNATAARAEKHYDEIVGKAKALLLGQHYDGQGKRRNMFPFTQYITPDLADVRSAWQKGH